MRRQHTRKRGKRLLALVMCLGLWYSVIPVSEPVLAAEETDAYDGDGGKTTVSAPKEDTLTVTYDTAQEAIPFPTLESEDGKTVEDVTWECGGYDKTKPGDYLFTAKLKDGYLTRDGKPITVTVSVQESAADNVGSTDASDETAKKDKTEAASEEISTFDAPTAVTYVDHGTWGDCDWTVKGTTLTVEPKRGAPEDKRTPGLVETAPWSMNPGERADMSHVTKIEITGKAQPDGLKSLFEGHLSPDTLNQPLDSLTTIDLTKFDTSEATNMEYMFYSLKGLTDVRLTGDFVTDKVTSMNNLFNSCEALKSVDLSNFNTVNVEDFTLFFGKCFYLETIIPPKAGEKEGFDTRKAKTLSRMFENCMACPNIQELISAPNFQTSNVEDFTGMFKECNTNLVRLDLSHFDFSKATVTEKMFYGDWNLQEVIFPENIDTSSVTNMEEMFFNCKSLTSLDLSNFDLSGIERQDSPDSTVAGGIRYYASMDAMFKDCTSLQSLDLSGPPPSAGQFGRRTFEGCDSLVAVRLHPNFEFGIHTENGEIIGNNFLPANTARPIAKTELKASGNWICPDGTVSAPEHINNASQGEGWYLLQPAEGAYAYFYAPDSSTTKPVFAASVNGRGTVPDVRSKKNPKLGARWCLDTDQANKEVDVLTTEWPEGTVRTYRSTEWARIPTIEDFDFTPLFREMYNGKGHPVTVTPHAGIGTVQNVRYIDPDFTTMWDAPVEAGTYYVCFDVSPNEEYASVANLKYGPYIIYPKPEPADMPAERGRAVPTGDENGPAAAVAFAAALLVILAVFGRWLMRKRQY